MGFMDVLQGLKEGLLQAQPLGGPSYGEIMQYDAPAEIARGEQIQAQQQAQQQAVVQELMQNMPAYDEPQPTIASSMLRGLAEKYNTPALDTAAAFFEPTIADFGFGASGIVSERARKAVDGLNVIKNNPMLGGLPYEGLSTRLPEFFLDKLSSMPAAHYKGRDALEKLRRTIMADYGVSSFNVDLSALPELIFDTVEGANARKYVNDVIEAMDNAGPVFRGANPVIVKRVPESDYNGQYEWPSYDVNRSTWRAKKIYDDDLGEIVMPPPLFLNDLPPKYETSSAYKHEALGHGRVVEGDIDFNLVRKFLDYVWRKPKTALPDPQNMVEYMFSPVLRSGLKSSEYEKFWKDYSIYDMPMSSVSSSVMDDPAETIAYWLETLAQSKSGELMYPSRFAALELLRRNSPQQYQLLQDILDSAHSDAALQRTNIETGEKELELWNKYNKGGTK
ncbi:MAG: hypothetical protein PHR07_03930 [Acidaminococcaceae bacterium]|nr:hypothetical protein [Acidaminococcaceae bacterium]